MDYYQPLLPPLSPATMLYLSLDLAVKILYSSEGPRCLAVSLPGLHPP